MPFLDPLKEQQLPHDHPRYKNGEGSRLTAPMRYYWARKDILYTCKIWTISDGASIPEVIPDVLLDDHGLARRPAYPHDDIYNAYLRMDAYSKEIWEGWHGKWTKRNADLMFFDALKDEGMDFVRRWVKYTGVRLNLIAAYKWGKHI
jgi:hypothetical protein